MATRHHTPEARTTDPARLGIVQARPMTYEEFLAWEPEGGLAEWIGGEGVQYMPASNTHQHVVNLLITLLNLFVSVGKLGKVFSGPYTRGSSRVDLQACKLGTGRRFTTS
jgi:hypothetical protein